MTLRKITSVTGLALAAVFTAPLTAAQAQQGTPVMSHRIQTGTAVHVTLLQKLDSGRAQTGDTVRVRVAQDDTSGLPIGTILLGRVTEARAATNRNPGVVALQFTTPTQNSNRPASSSTSDVDQETSASADAPSDTFLDEASARLVGKTRSSEKSNYASIGAGAGALLGFVRKRKLGDAVSGAVLGGAGGYAADQAQKHPASDVTLAKGAEMTLRLDTPLTVRTEILAPY
jgi:hypothetical protein